MSKIHTARQFAVPTTYFNIDGSERSATVPGLRKVELAAIEVAGHLSPVLDADGEFYFSARDVADRALDVAEALCDLLEKEYAGFGQDA